MVGVESAAATEVFESAGLSTAGLSGVGVRISHLDATAGRSAKFTYCSECLTRCVHVTWGPDQHASSWMLRQQHWIKPWLCIHASCTAGRRRSPSTATAGVNGGLTVFIRADLLWPGGTRRVCTVGGCREKRTGRRGTAGADTLDGTVRHSHHEQYGTAEKVRPVVRQPAGPRPEPPNSRLRLRRTSTGRCRNGFRRPVNHPSSFASRTERTHAIRCHVLRRFSRGRRGGDLPHHAGSRPAGGRRERKSAVGGTISGDHRFPEGELPEDLIEDLPDITYERHLHHGSLIGSPGSCGPVVERPAAAGVAEVAWLVGFGLTNDHLLAGIKPLFDPAELRQ